jgi:hypothetical protein
MATISINIPDAVQPRVLDAFAATYGRPEEIPDPNHTPTGPGDVVMIPNPETKAQFAKKMLQQHVREVLTAHEASAEAEAARQAKADQIAGELPA